MIMLMDDVGKRRDVYLAEEPLATTIQPAKGKQKQENEEETKGMCSLRVEPRTFRSYGGFFDHYPPRGSLSPPFIWYRNLPHLEANALTTAPTAHWFLLKSGHKILVHIPLAKEGGTGEGREEEPGASTGREEGQRRVAALGTYRGKRPEGSRAGAPGE